MPAEHSADADILIDDELVQSRQRVREEERRERWEHRKSIVRDALNDRVIELVTFLRGEGPTGRPRRGKQRWGRRGSFEINVTGRFRGWWRDFESGENGDLFTLIIRDQGRNFADAVEWGANWVGLSRDYKPTADKIRRKSEREAERMALAAREAAQDAVNDAAKLAKVRRKFNEARAIDGTPGERYLRETRAINALSWPSCIRWHDIEHAIVCAVTDDAGDLVAAQMIAVSHDGKKDAKRWPNRGGAKTSLGPISKGAVRLPGLADGPLCICEGPETGLTVWAATGYETYILLGGMRRAADVAPGNRRVIICRDDDKINSPAAKGAKAALNALRAKGVDAREVLPHASRKGDKSDFNDRARAFGLDAVRERIELASSDNAQPIPEFSQLAQARFRVGELVAQFFDATKTWLQGELFFPPVHAIGLDVGGGKTEAALDHAVRLLVELRKAGDMRVVVFLTPEHKLSHDVEQRARLKLREADPNMVVSVWRGRAAKVRPDSEEVMCPAFETVNAANALLADIGTEICCEKKCEFYEGCQYLLQRGVINIDLWIGSHNLLFNAPPTPINDRGIAAIVVDEGPFRAGLKSPIDIPLDAIDYAMPLPKKENERYEMMNARHRLARALADEPDGWIRREAFAKAPHFDVGHDLARSAKALEWLRKIKKREIPNWRERHGNSSLIPMLSAWSAVADLIADDGPAVSGWLRLAHNEEGVRVLRVSGRSDVHGGWNAPTLLIDALHDPESIRPFWPMMEDKGHVRIATPFQTMKQAPGKSQSLAHLSPSNGSDEDTKRRARNRRNIRSVILRLAREFGGTTLVVGNKSVVQAMEFPPHVEVAWFGAVAGRDNWKDVRLIVIVGRPQPNPSEVEWMASALTGRAVQELGKDVNGNAKPDAEMADTWYEKGDAFRFKRDGEGLTCILTSTDRHPDELCEGIRKRICEGELVQAIGRGRGVNRTTETPLEVVILSDVALPLPVDEFLPDDAIKASPVDLMLAEGGVAFDDGASAAKAYPQLWRTAAAARMAFQRERSESGTQDENSVTNAYREYSIGKRYADHRLCPVISFRRTGPKLHVECAIYDPRIVLDPRAAIEAMLGPLTMFELVGQEAGDEAPEKHDGLTHDGEAYIVALRAALGANGRNVRPDGSDAPATRAVDLEVVREAFYRSRPVEGNDEKKFVEARRKAFNRGKKAAIASGLIALDEARKLVWLIRPAKLETAPGADVMPTVSISNAVIVDDPPPLNPSPEPDPQCQPEVIVVAGTGYVVEPPVASSAVLRLWFCTRAPERRAA